MIPLNSVQIELTNHCNYKCLVCPHSEFLLTRKKGYMAESLYKKVVDECFDISREINFSFFGEQTLHPKFKEFMLFLKKRPFTCRVVINSNMSLVTREIFDLFNDMELDELRVSLDAARKETYDILRLSNSCLDLEGYEVVDENDRFEIINNKLKYWFLRHDHVPTRHVFTKSSFNEDEVEEYVNEWKPCLGDSDSILIKSVITYGGKSMMSSYPKIPATSRH